MFSSNEYMGSMRIVFPRLLLNQLRSRIVDFVIHSKGKKISGIRMNKNIQYLDI